MTPSLEEMLKISTPADLGDTSDGGNIITEQSEQSEQPPVITEDAPVTPPDPLPNAVDEGVDEIPAYMYTDAGMVGYSDSLVQTDIYNLALRGTIPLTGNVSILDIGAGRGDLFHHISSQLPTLNVKYSGYEANPLLATIGNEKISTVEGEESASISATDFLTAQIDDQFSLVYLIGSLNLNYGTDAQPWEYLEMMLRKALDVTELGGIATFILLHDTGGEENYIAYPIPNITDLIMKFNMPFTVDYGSIPSIYKLSIKKEPIFITQ